MIDVSSKDVVLRIARAEGSIVLKPETLERISRKEIRKGDPLSFAEAAALVAVKQTHVLIPHCHPLPIEAVELSFQQSPRGIRVECEVKARARTGVEMEALVGVTAALTTLWDMVKYLEKDDQGQYSHTSITGIRVLSKEKGEEPL